MGVVGLSPCCWTPSLRTGRKEKSQLEEGRKQFGSEFIGSEASQMLYRPLKKLWGVLRRSLC